MQIRHPPKSTKASSSWATVVLFTAVSFAMFSFLYSGWFQSENLPSDDNKEVATVLMSPANEEEGSPMPEVVYTTVATGDPKVLRYAAYSVGSDGKQHPLSVAQWAASMAHPDDAYATKMARNLTKIIQVTHHCSHGVCVYVPFQKISRL